MKVPWECTHEKIRIERYDHGVDKRLVLFCASGCKKKLGEQMSTTLFLNENDEDDYNA